MKEIILTVDYELFLGDITGTVKECMIEPTQKLASILEKNGSKMTIFWDILHFYQLIEFEKSFPELLQRRLSIEEQILTLIKRGHDIQLHLHPHWLDASFENNKWNFTYDRFKLHNLSSENNPNDINTIIGCITISKKLMGDTIRKVNPDYKVTSFRAGGYLVEPFDRLRDAFLRNDIKIDSSVCPGLHNPSFISSYDFRFYPNKTKYNFDSTPKIITDNGKFIEIPITTIHLSIFRNIFYKFVRRIKYPFLEKERRGIGLGAYYEDSTTSNTKKLFTKLFSLQSTQLTTDSNFREKFNHLYKKIPAYSTMILHSKLLNNHTIGILDDYVSTNKIRFISIQDYLAKNKG